MNLLEWNFQAIHFAYVLSSPGYVLYGKTLELSLTLGNNFLHNEVHRTKVPWKYKNVDLQFIYLFKIQTNNPRYCFKVFTKIELSIYKYLNH